jgi:SAM-dependent methyltransferase
MSDTPINCRICRSSSLLFYEDTRKFFVCSKCHHIFTRQSLSEDQSHQYYQTKWGSEDDSWWKEVAEQIMWDVKLFRQPGRILNFGSGRGDLSKQIEAMGYDVTSFEPMIHGSFCDQDYEEKFDTIIATEVIEHLMDIHEELHRLFAVLARGGLLFFSTLISNPFDTPDPVGHFSRFWYKDDQTHVNFFCNKSIETLAGLYHCEHILVENNGFILLPIQD